MDPKKVKSIILKYNKLFNDRNVTFSSSSYDKINYLDNSLLYLDPPYENTKGMYFNNFNNDKFIKWLNLSKSNWILSYDGGSIIDNNQLNYKKHLYLDSGNSSFKRILGNSRKSNVSESIYINL